MLFLILADSDIEISAEKLAKLTAKANVEVESIWTDIYAKALEVENLRTYSSTSKLLQLVQLPLPQVLLLLLVKLLLKKKPRKKKRKNPTMTWVWVCLIR